MALARGYGSERRSAAVPRSRRPVPTPGRDLADPGELERVVVPLAVASGLEQLDQELARRDHPDRRVGRDDLPAAQRRNEHDLHGRPCEAPQHLEPSHRPSLVYHPGRGLIRRWEQLDIAKEGDAERPPLRMWPIGVRDHGLVLVLVLLLLLLLPLVLGTWANVMPACAYA